MLEIGIELATAHSYGRQFAEGFAAHATKLGHWRLRPINAETLSVQSLAKLDGAVARVLNPSAEAAIRRSGIPFVDIYCERSLPGIARVTTDNVRIGRMPTVRSF